ncbi:MAG: transporter substrate-binding domain-containing protein [Solobacterium sp.]|nr:transporter substrate-binding domain-containing protein [Solobacterium sp.]
MNTSKLFKAALAAAAALTMTACGNKDTSASTATETAEAQHVIIGISPDYPPYDDLTADGQLAGFDYEMGEWLFTWMEENGCNYTHEWKQMSFDTIISAIQADQVDLGISGFTYDSERKVLFSEPYHESAEVALAVDTNEELNTVEDLAGKTIGVQLGTTGESCANEIEGATVQAIEDMGICVESLKGGAYDAVIMDKPVAENYVNAGGYKILEGTLLDEQNYVIAKEGNDQLMNDVNKAIKAFLESDDCAAMKEKYGL